MNIKISSLKMPYGIPACKNRNLMIHNNKFFRKMFFIHRFWTNGRSFEIHEKCELGENNCFIWSKTTHSISFNNYDI